MLTSKGYIWSEREDSNLRPPAPEAGALPGCATLRPMLRVKPNAGALQGAAAAGQGNRVKEW